MVPTGSLKEQAGEGQCSFWSLYVEFLSAEEFYRAEQWKRTNSVCSVTVLSWAVLWVQT